MRIKFGVVSVFLVITGAALVGMILGGLFGLAAGLLTPKFFGHFMPWQDVEPLGFAIVLGAFGGVICGGGLGTFSVVVQFFADWLAVRKKPTLSKEKVAD